MKKTALVAVAALLVTMGSTMAFASTHSEKMDETKFNQMVKEYRAERIAKYQTDDQITRLDELATNYQNSIADLVKETAKMRIELNHLVNNTVDPDPEVVSALETELWEKTGQLADANKAFKNNAKSINPAFPYAVNAL